MKIIGGTDKDKEDEARKRADALAKAISKMLPQHLSHGELLAALSSVLAAAFAEDGSREDLIKAMRDLTASVLAEFGARKRRQRLGQRHIPEEDGDDPGVTKVSLMPMQKARRATPPRGKNNRYRTRRSSRAHKRPGRSLRKHRHA
jgi:hypothetical protein